MHDWWQIVGLTLLTLIVAGILKRAVILIVLGRIPHSYKLIQNQTNEPSSQSSDYRRFNANGELVWGAPEFSTDQGKTWISEDEWRKALNDLPIQNLDDSLNDQYENRATGITPGGVGFVMTPHAGGVPVTKGQLGFRWPRKKGKRS